MVRRFHLPRWLKLGGAIALGLAVALAAGFYLFYPDIAAWAIRSKVLNRVEKRLDRQVRAGQISVTRDGRAVLRDVVVRGPDDGEAPLVRIGRVTIYYGFWAALRGDLQVDRVVLEDVHGAAQRNPDGTSNFGDLLKRFSGKGGAGGGVRRGLRPRHLELLRGSAELHDRRTGLDVSVGGISLTAEAGGQATMTLGQIAAATDLGPRANLDQVVMTADVNALRDTASFDIGGGKVSLWPKMSLTGIGGTVGKGDRPGQLTIDLTGGYGGVEGKLWTAEGWVDPWQRLGSLQISADRFTFNRIAPVLADSMVVDYDKTSIDVHVGIDLTPSGAEIDGNVALSGLNLYHPMLAEKTVRDIDLEGPISLVYDSAARKLTLTQADFEMRGVKYQLDGLVALPGGIDTETGEPRQFRHVAGRLVIPPLPCQKMLQGIPEEFAPNLKGFKLVGTFSTDLSVDIDWGDLDATRLDGGVGIRRCRVKKVAEEIDAKQYLETFTHVVEAEKDHPIEIVIGPENPDFVPIWDVSPYLLKSLMTTEDSRFYQHHGFIVSEFRTALIKNLKAGRFKYGASSITMQMVKNVLLSPVKTLSRKFQELFFTWYVETVLPKDRILEIYLNAIEYGPELYGIGPASRRYFGKHPRDLNPVEAAFFSSILPDPKGRYLQYCDDKLWTRTQHKIERILKLMAKRERLTEDEAAAALATPLVFDRNEATPERECREFVKTVTENTIPTDPVRRIEWEKEQAENPRSHRDRRR